MYPGNYALTQPDKPAAIRISTGETLTYRALDERSNQLARVLRAAGLREGDHVALFLENNLAYFDAIWACMRSGLYLTPVNHHLSAAEAAYIVDNCDAKVLIASGILPQTPELGRLATRCDTKLMVGGAAEGFLDYEVALASQSSQSLDEERLGSFMFYSSGTTGRPKGIRRNLTGTDAKLGNPGMFAMGNLFGFNKQMVYLSPAPLYHAAPMGFACSVTQVGGTAVILDKFDPELALQTIERRKITHSQWVPAMFVKMLQLDGATRDRYDLSSHILAIHAAAPCPIEVKRRMIDWWGPILEEYYASTESAGLAKITSEEWLTHPGSVGRAWGAPFHICGEDGEEMPAGAPGLLYGEASPGAGFSYHKDADKTASARHPSNSNWVTVGDIGYLDADGYLYLTDRKSFMIISGGVNIYPQQIEDALTLHPKITDVAVIGVPNAELGEEIKAIVQPAPGVTPSPALAQEIMDFVREKLGRQLTPRTVDFIEELPRLATGKLAKKVLRDPYWGDTSATLSLAARS